MGSSLCRISGLLEALVGRCFRLAKLQDLAAAPCPRTSGRDPPAQEMAAHVAPLPMISDAAFIIPRRVDRCKPARRLSAPSSSSARDRQHAAPRKKRLRQQQLGGEAPFVPL